MAASKLIYTSTANMSPIEWLMFRDKGIGASETGCVLGLSPYKSRVELFYEKINPKTCRDPDTVPSFMGRYMEDHIADLWQYWEVDKDQLAMQMNYEAGNKIRSMQRVNAYIQNPKYPHLFVSLDRRMNKYKGLGNGCLEIKTIGGYEADKWTGGLPPYHICQINTQMLVTEWKHGEIAALRDGRYLEVYPFTPHAGMKRAIIKETSEFWERVRKARICLTQKFEAESNFNTRKVREIETELMRLEPDPDGSEAMASFLKEKYLNAEPLSERSGTLEEFYIAQDHLKLKTKKKTVDESLLLKENVLKNKIKDFECITFGDGGRVYWKNDANGVRRFNNKVVLTK